MSDTIDIHTLEDLQLQVIWVFDKHTGLSPDRLSAAYISNYLIEECGINTSRQAVTNALSRDKKSFNKNKTGYKLMEPGRRKLSALLGGSSVILIEPGKPFSAKNLALKSIFDTLEKEIMICDPYIDIHTLDFIFKYVDKKISIKILTKNIIDKPKGTFTRHLSDLRGEGYKIEIGIYTSSDLHDRYLMDKRTFWLSGNSINHLGKKESFIVRLGEDMRQSLTTMFSQRWKVAVKQ